MGSSPIRPSKESASRKWGIFFLLMHFVRASYTILGLLSLLAYRRGLGSSVANAIITGRKEGTTDERTQ
jgi:hypothetical protein